MKPQGPAPAGRVKSEGSDRDVMTERAAVAGGRSFGRETVEQLYAAQREQLIAAGFPTTALVVFGVTLLYQCADLIFVPAAFRAELKVDLLQLSIPLLALALARGPFRGRVERVALGADLAYTAVLAGRLLLPTTTVSGTALFLSLKMLATALLLPWDARTQYVSAFITVVLYWGLLAMHEQTAVQGWPPVHQLVGPLIGALLSATGAAAGERSRRALFLQNLRLARSQQRLAVSEARYRNLFEHANDLIFVVDEAERFRFANQAAVRFAAPNGTELADVHLAQVLPPESLQRIRRRLRAARRSGDGGAPFEVDVVRPDGSRATLEVRARRVNEPDEPLAYQCIARDVSDRRRQEAATQSLLRSLQESNQLQTEFVANTSHELRTPLSVIVGYADLLIEDPRFTIGSEVRGFIERIGTSARALHRLVEGVLEFARLDRGRVQIMPTDFPADTLLLELRGLCNDIRSSEEPRIEIPDAPGIDLHTDYDRLYSILSNLLLNAVKFTPRGTVELITTQTGEEVEFRVRDTGIGIPEEDLAHIFEPFRQVDGSTTRAFTGVGLGLAIVQRNIDLLGGEIRVESLVGGGSTFSVRIPRRFAITRDASASRRPPQTARPGAGGGATSVTESRSL